MERKKDEEDAESEEESAEKNKEEAAESEEEYAIKSNDAAPVNDSRNSPAQPDDKTSASDDQAPVVEPSPLTDSLQNLLQSRRSGWKWMEVVPKPLLAIKGKGS